MGCLDVRKLFLFTLLFSILLTTGCNDKVKTFKTEGKSEHWNASVIFEFKTEKNNGEEINTLNNGGTIVYLNDGPPNEIHFEYLYPNGVSVATTDTIKHLEESINEFRVGVVGSVFDEADTYNSLRDIINQTLLLVKWNINNEPYEEYIQFNIIE